MTKMEDTNIYYDPKDHSVLITSNFSKYQKGMDLDLFPRSDYKKIDVSEFEKFTIKDLAFDEIENDYFQDIKKIFSLQKYNGVVFRNTNVILGGTVLNVDHLLIGENSKINISQKNFKDLSQITFLSVKTFKGKILDVFTGVEKLTLWYENKKTNDIISLFPKLKELYIYNGTMPDLDLTKNHFIKILNLHRCIRLEKVILHKEIHLKEVIIEACNKLDISNLTNVERLARM